MRHLILLILLSLFIVPGCTFLKGKSDSSADEFADEGMDDTFSEDDEFMEDEDEYAEDEDEYAEDGDEYAEDEDEEYAEYEDEYAEDEEKEKKGGLRGFFSRLFGSSDEDEEDEDSELMEDDEFMEDEDEEYAEYEDDEVSQEEIKEFFEDEEETPQQAVPADTKQSTQETVQTPVEQPKSYIPLNKIRSVSYRKAGYLINAVYIARPGDTLESVSQKIYGFDRSGDLRKINSHLQHRMVKVGDKIYYNSPNRTGDSSRLLFYYQDVNLPSSFYTLSPGDNIRQVASQLLGHPNSWKEIWATNPNLESKGAISNNTSIIYWPKGSSSAPVVESPTQIDEPEEQVVKEDLPEEGLPPPPIALEEEKEKPKDIVKTPEKKGGLEIIKQKEIVFILLVIIAILILLIRLFLKKRKQRDFDYTATNIEV